MEDKDIVALYHSRDERAVRETQHKYGRYLTKVAHNILGSCEETQDCVNDTYMRAWETMPPHAPNILSAFLAGITRCLSIDVWRKKHAEKRSASQYALSLDELAECVGGGGAEQLAETRELSAAISRFLWEQPQKARCAFVARYFFMDPLKDVAKLCGMSEGGMKSLLFRMRAALKEYLIKEGYDI